MRTLLAVALALLTAIVPVATASASGYRVVLDPGHGGSDPGTSSTFLGSTEKEVVLRLALQTGAALQRRGVQVTYTRTSDRDVPLGTRAATPGQVGAQALLSLHLNSAPNPNASGAEIWYGDGRQSAAFASTVLAAASGALLANGVAVRGTRYGAELAVLHTTVPSALLEVGYVTNQGDAAALGHDAFLGATADALADGVVRFLRAQGGGESGAQAALESLRFVRVGDTLGAIAAQVRLPLSELHRLNPTLLPDRLQIGQPVLVHRASASSEPAAVLVASSMSQNTTLRPSLGPRSAPTGASTGLSGIHVVAPGESLSEIAERYHLATHDLAEWNGIENPDKVVAGVRLRLGATDATVADAAAVAPGGWYVVQPGDTVYSLTRRWAVRVDQVQAVNHLTDANLLIAGTRLRRPAKPAQV